MPNEAIKIELGANFGTVLKIIDKNHSDGLRSGMRIVTMKYLILKAILFQTDLLTNPTSS